MSKRENREQAEESSMEADPEDRKMRLLDLPLGAVARICSVPVTGNGHPRLVEMGFVPGTRLRIIRAAPLGDPIEIEIRDIRICARRADLRGFLVTPEGNE